MFSFLILPCSLPPLNLVDTKQHTVSLGMDMKLEWLTLEDFQKHLDGNDENHVSAEVLSASE